MLQRRWQPRPLRASFPPMPSPATSDRRAASYLARLREWRRQDRTSLLHRSGSTRVSSSSSASAAAAPERPLQRRQTAERIIAHRYSSDHLYDRLLATSREARADGRQVRGVCRALCAGVWRRPRVHTTPWPWLENCRNRADCDHICRGSCEPQKHLRVGEEWAGTDKQTVLRARKMG